MPGHRHSSFAKLISAVALFGGVYKCLDLTGDNNDAAATQTMSADDRAAYDTQQEIESEMKRRLFGDFRHSSGRWPENSQNVRDEQIMETKEVNGCTVTKLCLRKVRYPEERIYGGLLTDGCVFTISVKN